MFSTLTKVTYLMKSPSNTLAQKLEPKQLKIKMNNQRIKFTQNFLTIIIHSVLMAFLF